MLTRCKSRILFPMMLTDDDLRSFIAAYELDFHETILPTEAGELARRVMALFELLTTDPDQGKDVQAP